MRMHQQHWLQHLFALLTSCVPSTCALCGTTDPTSLCEGCRKQFFSRPRSRCIRCAIPVFASAHTCGACLKHPPAFDRTFVAVDYAAPLDQLALTLKFGGRLNLAPLLAEMIQDAFYSTEQQIDLTLLTAVPLGRRRLAERGFNQALEIAKPLARALSVKLNARLVLRQRETDAQALLPPDARRKNMQRAFAVPDAMLPQIQGQHIGVIDDVITTGETLNAVAMTLKRAGAATVTNLVFARTPEK